MKSNKNIDHAIINFEINLDTISDNKTIIDSYLKNNKSIYNVFIKQKEDWIDCLQIIIKKIQNISIIAYQTAFIIELLIKIRMIKIGKLKDDNHECSMLMIKEKEFTLKRMGHKIESITRKIIENPMQFSQDDVNYFLIIHEMIEQLLKDVEKSSISNMDKYPDLRYNYTHKIIINDIISKNLLKTAQEVISFGRY